MLRSIATLLAVVSLPMTTVAADASDLPAGVVDTQDPTDVSLSPEQSRGRIRVPAGFHVTLFAGEPDVRRPIAFDFDDRGRLWVVENYAHPDWHPDAAVDRIVIFEDADQDGRFDNRRVFWDQGRYLTGIAIGHGGVWIANTPELSFIPDLDRDDVPDGPPQVMLDGFAISKHNVLNNFHWGPDGWLYAAIGLPGPSHVGPPGTPPEARTRMGRGIWRYHPVRREFEVVALGMVNPWGADFNAYGDLFTTNTVIAHLWHIVPGMFCQVRGKEQDNALPYGRIQSITDHLHWGGGMWTASRGADHRHSVAGGGHAHCGAMVYLGDNWPAPYRGTFFTANLHGNRVNNDRLIPRRSTYVGVHADDFLIANDRWFRGLSIKYGPDGGVFVSDWHDVGECHDSDGSHRSSGRIYKVVYGETEPRQLDLAALSDLELAQLHTHENEWFVRHARRILHERATRGDALATARPSLRELFLNGDEIQRLRALWTRYLIGDLQQADLVGLLQDQSQHIRRWAARLLVDDGPPGSAAVDKLIDLGRHDDSAPVRLALASAIQRLETADRWRLVNALASRGEDCEDPYLPLMIWYGVEPLVMADPRAALDLATATPIGTLRRYVTRRLLDDDDRLVEEVTQAILDSSSDAVRGDMVQGVLDAMQGRDGQTAPPSWPELHRQLATSPHPELRSRGVQLAMRFGDLAAIGELRRVAAEPTGNVAARRDALESLLRIDRGADATMLHSLIERGPSELQSLAIRGLATRFADTTGQLLLSRYHEFEPAARQDAIGVLVMRREFAAALLDAISDGIVPRADISAFAVQQLRAHQDEALGQRIDRIWSNAESRLDKSEAISRYKKLLTADYLETGNAAKGRAIFAKSCARCHTLFGEGGSLAPDLTGSGRKDLDYLLSNLIDPSANVDPAYRLTNVATLDGRVLSGFMIQHAETFVVLRTEQADVRLNFDNIEFLDTSGVSMMPEGMLEQFSDEQVRDLFAYLAGDRQVPLPLGEGGSAERLESR